jgi:hypothetical protein
MTDPLLLRLRNPVYLAVVPQLDVPLAVEAMKEAADEIERLRKIIDLLRFEVARMN